MYELNLFYKARLCLQNCDLESFFFSETIPHMLNFNRKQWLKAMLFHNPEVHCFHLKLLSL